MAQDVSLKTVKTLPESKTINNLILKVISQILIFKSLLHSILDSSEEDINPE